MAGATTASWTASATADSNRILTLFASPMYVVADLAKLIPAPKTSAHAIARRRTRKSAPTMATFTVREICFTILLA